MLDYLTDTTMHEVGHTLGFQHNFRSSGIYSLKQIQDPEFTKKNGLTGSVMEYSPINLALKGEKQGAFFTPTLGAYDYWAIEYAYKPIAPDRMYLSAETLAKDPRPMNFHSALAVSAASSVSMAAYTVVAPSSVVARKGWSRGLPLVTLTDGTKARIKAAMQHAGLI